MEERDYRTDVALMTVTITEFRGVMHFHDWKAKTFPNDDQIYDVAEFERDGKKRSLGHAKMDEMGMTAAAGILLSLPAFAILVSPRAAAATAASGGTRSGMSRTSIVVPWRLPGAVATSPSCRSTRAPRSASAPSTERSP